ncbi:unnamed protein product [Ixodes persulcatus]
MIQVGGESNGEGNDHECLQSTTPAVASLLQATQASGDLLSQPRIPQVRSVAPPAETSAHQVATTVSVVTSSGVPITGTASYQHFLAPAVSMGGHIQNITIPAQVSVTSPGVAVAAASPSQQNLARILAVANQHGYGSPGSAKGLLSPPRVARLAATSPAALLATTQPLAQQQAIVMDTMHDDDGGHHQYVVQPATSPQVVPRPPPPSPPPTAQFLVPKRTALPPSSTTSSGVGSPARVGGLVGVECPRASKRPKLEERPAASEEVAALRQRIHEYRWRELRRNKERYVEHLTELFFLQNGGNMMDYYAWKRRPTPQLVAMLRAHALDSEDEEDPLQLLDTRPPSSSSAPASSSSSTGTTAVPPVASVAGQHATPPGLPSPSPLAPGSRGPSLPSSQSPGPSPQQLQQQLQPQQQQHHHPQPQVPRTPGSPLRHPPAPHQPASGGSPSSKARQALAAAVPSSPAALVLPAGRLATRQHSISAVYDSSIGSQEEIVERAKQEAYVMQRIAELRREGMWSARRLPKVQEPPRAKAHWDYLLEEMVWLATDFAQERKWKKAAAKKCARMVLKYHQERDLKAERAEKEELQKLRRIAGQVAKEIKLFWANIEKLVEFKQQTRLEEKRKKALDLHLNFIMDQTEKYSSWLREGMADRLNNASAVAADKSDAPPAPSSPARSGSSNDEDFEPDLSDSDDEETIDREESASRLQPEEQSRELELLQREGELPLDQLLDSLPPEILEGPAPRRRPSHSSQDDGEASSDRSGSPIDLGNVRQVDDSRGEEDEEFLVGEEEGGDDEATMEEQEEQEQSVDHTAELKELAEEGEMSLEALYEKYRAAYSSDFEVPNSIAGSDEDEDVEVADNEQGKLDSSEEEEEDEEEEEEEDMDTSSEGEVQDIGMEYLINPMSDEVDAEAKASAMRKFRRRDFARHFRSVEKGGGDSCKGPTKEITDIAATAQSFQPKGNTLSTTQVATKVPWLLKHTLREYQHIGLDWLVTMHDKKLNGILADEMGLGKTIQTISLLAHMACDKGVWGPHLIVVPTSVMLNWEMEFKKWCPAFKILTYYGVPKERKQKRQGWTKPNAFHVCITSYKLVVQDHQAFRRKKWKYFILDEAQNIKNFKSQRWQMLLNFQSSRRLLLTGTPLQNSLMELWSLMHFLMPNVFQSHREFREWFANPVTGMIEGNSDYNESLIRRLHKVLRPFLLRRLKCEVEKQLPKKYEHVVFCQLTKRQRYLYDDFMAQTKTKETLATGNFMSVINVLMQLRKVCNHPNMFEPRPIVSPYRMEGLVYYTASCVYDICKYNPFKHVSFSALNLLLADVELCLTAFAAHRIKKFQTSCHFVETIESHPPPPPRCPPGKIRLHIRTSAPSSAQGGAVRAASPMVAGAHHHAHHHQRLVASGAHPGAVRPSPGVGATTYAVARAGTLAAGGAQVATGVPLLQQQQRLVVVSTPGSAPSSRAQSPVAATGVQGASSSAGGGEYMLQLVQKTNALSSNQVVGPPITVQIQQSGHGGGPARLSMPFGIGRLVQTTTGQHLLLTPAAGQVTAGQGAHAEGALGGVSQQQQQVMLATSAIQTTAVRTTAALSQVGRMLTSSAGNAPVTAVPAAAAGGKPVVRVAPLNVNNQLAAAAKNVNAKAPLAGPVKGTTASTESSSSRGPLYLESLENRRRQQRRDKLRLLGQTNALRCAACPTYGRDLVEAVTVVQDPRPPLRCRWGGTGYVACLNAPTKGDAQLWRYTRALRSLVHTPPQLLDQMRDLLTRFVFAVPGVTAPRIEMRVSHPSPSSLNAERVLEERLRDELGPQCAFLHPIVANLQTQFPELRLIQYDCGKLQVLDRLLWQLRGGQHRVLIFTQMTRMLDILEQFLNYHGHTYLRLDGSTRVDQRQALMERFNADRRIFCFILSTRSGGIGVNLTGADTVVFYDSDWNPTMDAQAQDRCHRIGQTRDVHIYRQKCFVFHDRLISRETVEENILKKATQKRMLGDVAIEGGNFTTAFFKKTTLKDLFGNNFDTNEAREEPPRPPEERPPDGSEKFSAMEFEKALGMAEEELDVQAAHTARAEAAAELAEFDESIPLDTDSRDNEEKSQAEEELDKLMDQAVEKYAMQFLESLQEPLTLEQLKQAEEEIEAQKKDWELGRLKAIKEEEEHAGKWAVPRTLDGVGGSVRGLSSRLPPLQIWAPPTPPQDENDLYIDYSVGFLYEPSVMSESNLPEIHVKKEAKRLKVDALSTGGCPLPLLSRGPVQKARKEDAVHIPKSLFDRPTAAILKMRREAKMQKVKNLMVSGGGGIPGGSTGGLAVPKALVGGPLAGVRPLNPGAFMAARPLVDLSQDTPEWLIHEDWAALQVLQQMQDIPLNLTVLSPGHTPNWDLMSDVVNAVSRIYRSPKQCKDRYETVIVPREEGKILYDTNPKKQKKTKGIYKGKENPRFPARKMEDDRTRCYRKALRGRALIKLYEPTLAPSSQTVGKKKKEEEITRNVHISLRWELVHHCQLSSLQIEVTSFAHSTPVVKLPVSPCQVAAEAQRQQAQAGGAAATPVAGVAQVAAPGSAAAALLAQQQVATQAVLASLGQPQQLQPGTQLQKGVTTVALAKSLGTAGGILVSTAVTTAATTASGGVVTAAPTFALTKVPVTAVATLTQGTLRAQRPQTAVVGTAGVTTTMTMQDIMAVATGQVRGLAASGAQAALVTTATTAAGSAPAVVSVTGLAPAQLQAAPQRIAAVAAGGHALGSLAAWLEGLQGEVTRAHLDIILARRARRTPDHLEPDRSQMLVRRYRMFTEILLVTISRTAAFRRAATSLSLNRHVKNNTAPTALRAPSQKKWRSLFGLVSVKTEVMIFLYLKFPKTPGVATVQGSRLTASQLQAMRQNSLYRQQQQQQQQQQRLQPTLTSLLETSMKHLTTNSPGSAVTAASASSLATSSGSVSVSSAIFRSIASKPATTVSQQQQVQLRQLQIQQHLLQQQQRKVTLQTQKVPGLSQLQSKGSSPGLAAQLGTVQIVQQGSSGGAKGGALPSATAITVQQIIKQVLPVNQNFLVSTTSARAVRLPYPVGAGGAGAARLPYRARL